MQEIITMGLLIGLFIEVTYLVALNFSKKLSKKSGRTIFVDTSVLIDGRILSLAHSGFIGDDTLYITRSVVGELQYLADNADNEKRARARQGLDNINELQGIPGLNVQIYQDGSKAKEGVDERLLNLAKRYNGAICTIDFNLNKVAQVENIQVLNINDLAMSLRMAYLPGEKMELDLTQKGQDSHQAVGHLSDGTMVVVERASQLIGQKAEIEFIRSLQTSAGKMMFAKLTSSSPQSHDNNKYVKKVTKSPRVNKQRTVENNKSGNSRPQPKSSSQREDDLVNLLNSK